MIRGACEKCVDEPCPLCAKARDLIRAWTRERRFQLGEHMCLRDVWIPDQEALDKSISMVVEKHKQASCDCSCHGLHGDFG